MISLTQLQTPVKSVEHFNAASKVWVYQLAAACSDDVAQQLQVEIDAFAKQWTAHNIQLHAVGFVAFNRAIVLMVDESHAGASGCSIDTSVHFIQSLEKKYALELFNRMIVHYLNGETWQTSLLTDISGNKQINGETIVIDPLVRTKAEFDAAFTTPVNKCWIAQFL